VTAFLARRLALAAVVLAAFSFVSFVLFAHLQPPPRPSVLPEYWAWLRGVWSGTSLYAMTHGSSFFPAVLVALGHTAALLGLTLGLVLVFSIGLAVAAARWRDSAFDALLRGCSYLAWGVPAFLVAFLVQQLLNALGGSRGLGPFPLAGWPGSCPAAIGLNYSLSGGLTPCARAGSGLLYLVHLLTHLVLPAAALALGFIGLHSRYLRAALVESLDAPFIVTAHAKGLSERSVIFRHALRASLAMFVSALLADFGAIFGAALAIDYVFQLGGLGYLYVHEFRGQTGSFDLYSVEALLLVTAVLVLLSSLLAELSVDLLDPRVRASR
jgi:peptide/nickel transport system permease protein